jgi:hypothetical protein
MEIFEGCFATHRAFPSATLTDPSVFLCVPYVEVFGGLVSRKRRFDHVNRVVRLEAN